MEEKLQKGEAIDLARNPKLANGDYVLKSFVPDKDYCDSKEEAWIWSIGRNIYTKEIIASTSGKFYENPEYDCLFVR